MLRNIGAVVVGLVVGSTVNMALILLNAKVLFPMPVGMDMYDPVQLNAYVATLPAAAFLVVIAAHQGQAFVGGWIAARLAASKPMRLALIVGALTLLGGLENLRTIDGPWWMAVEIPLYLLVAWAAGKLEQGRRERVDLSGSASPSE